MTDQADGLRRGVPARASARDRRDGPGDGPAVFVVGSGKGGAGKSVLSILLAASMARAGGRVLLVDGAQNQANLHVLLGVRPRLRLGDLMRGEAGLEELPVAVRPGLWLLPAESGAEHIYSLAAMDRARLHQRLTGLYDGFEAVIVDAGPGLESAVRATMRATRLVVIAVPEPAALSDAYALVKIVHLQAPSLPVDVLVNRAEGPADGSTAFERLALAARTFLRRELGCLGVVGEDPAVRAGVRQPGSLPQLEVPAVTEAARRLAAALPRPAAALHREAS
jgi:flagellar biosynthesis protein FlhG